MSQKQKKRSSDQALAENTKKINKNKRKEDGNDEQMDEESSEVQNDNELVFEDPFGDEFEEEIIENNEEEEDDEGNEEENPEKSEIQQQTAVSLPPKQVWRPGIDKLPEGEELEYDPSAYIMYHSLRTEWPCLSFDVLKDNLGENRMRFPMKMFLVTGSQADQVEKNKITLLQLSDLHKTYVAPGKREPLLLFITLAYNASLCLFLFSLF
jgi:ribosome assembly protein RRB1